MKGLHGENYKTLTKESEDTQTMEMRAMLTDGGRRAVTTAMLPSALQLQGRRRTPTTWFAGTEKPIWVVMGRMALQVYSTLLNYTLK